jgi:hypothetical protein
MTRGLWPGQPPNDRYRRMAVKGAARTPRAQPLPLTAMRGSTACVGDDPARAARQGPPRGQECTGGGGPCTPAEGGKPVAGPRNRAAAGTRIPLRGPASPVPARAFSPRGPGVRHYAPPAPLRGRRAPGRLTPHSTTVGRPAQGTCHSAPPWRVTCRGWGGGPTAGRKPEEERSGEACRPRRTTEHLSPKFFRAAGACTEAPLDGATATDISQHLLRATDAILRHRKAPPR